MVEGRYDKNTLAQTVDATVITLGGFSVFNDKEKLAFLRRLAEKQGLIILTDSDGAGFVIRNYLKGALPKELVKQAYIPDIHGKERRKRVPGKEGKLGVEGMEESVLSSILEFASSPKKETRDPVTNTDLYNAGLLGASDSKKRRAAYQNVLGLPAHLSPRKFLEILNLLRTREEFLQETETIL